MRILFVSHSFPPPGASDANVGGMQRVAVDLFETLSRRPDVDLHALVLETSWRQTHLRTPLFMAKALRDIPALVARHRVEVVLFSSMVTGALSLALRRRLRRQGARTFAIAHGRDVTLPSAPYQRLLPYVFGALDGVLPVSQATAAECLVRGLPERKVHVVHNGVHAERFGPAGPRDGARARLAEAFGGLPGDAFLLLSAGRQVERKGFHWFVEHVVPRLPARVHYWLAGDGPMAGTIDAAARAHGLDARVRRLGRVSDAQLEALFRGADLFVMPNVPVPGDMEGFGVVMLEAGLCGLPIVAADLEGIRDAVRDGRNGHRVPPLDPGAYARAITAYVDDPAALAEASQRAGAFVRDTFSWEAAADAYLAVFRRHPG